MGYLGRAFTKKNAPDYTPSFIKTSVEEDIEYIVCNDLKTLLWLGNQLAIEFHIPFKTVDTMKPTEIVFDLDPPSVDDFALAIEAALSMKAIFDKFNLHSFVKTSGGKAYRFISHFLRIDLPLMKHGFSQSLCAVFS